jgi:hypothetical protein
MRLKHNPEQPESDPGDGHSEAGDDRPGIGLREFLARQRVELDRQRVELEGHVAEAERRLRELESRTAQAELRASVAESKLEQAERRAADAAHKLSSSKLKPRASRRLAEARRGVEGLARERALKGRVAELIVQIGKLQRTLEGERSEHEAHEADLQQRLAEGGAEHDREHTMRIELEQRLAAEVAERQRIERELDALEQSYTGPALAGEREPSELQRARSADDGFAASSATAPGAAKAEAGALPEAGALSAGDRTSDGPFPEEGRADKNEMRGRRLPFLRRRSSLPCAVCRRPRPAMSDAEATASGWELAGAGALCPTCRREGWQFPRGATVPFRAADPRSLA